MLLFIALFLLTINYCFIHLFGKFNYQVLGCGIAGYIPKKGQKVNLDKMFFLAIANEERGTDSCGIAIGNEYCQYGVKVTNGADLSKARDFIAEKKEEIKGVKLLNNPVIFHTRRSTKGVHSKVNCHPMRYNWPLEDGKHEYLTLAHNGSVTNDWELFKKYVQPYSTKAKFVDYIDTRVFAHGFANAMCHKEDGRILEMLKEYKGAAAFLFYTNAHFYVWKGAAGNVEERPMYYVETKEGWYFHSIASILQIMFNQTPIQVGNNTLLTFTQEGIVDTLVVPRTAPPTTTYYHNSYNDHYQAPKSKAVVNYNTNPLKMNTLGFFVQSGKNADGVLQGIGSFCKGFSVYYVDSTVEAIAKRIASCNNKEELDVVIKETHLKGFVGRIPIMDKQNKVVALYDITANAYLKEGEIFRDNRMLKNYIYKNQQVSEYVTESSNN
jgi:predicted glutamine amidotransferase